MKEITDGQNFYNLAGFDDELERIKSLLDNMESGNADYRFLNYYAPGGFAKSYLMDRISAKYNWSMPVSLVRVDEFLEVEPFDRNGMLHQILHDFSKQLKIELPSDSQNENNPLILAQMIVDMMNSARKSVKTSLFLIDDYDHLPLTESRWLERNLLNPLAALQSVAFVLTSEYELSFNDDFNFRLRHEISEITTMKVEDIAQSFPAYQPLAKEFYELSSGIVAFVIGLYKLATQMKITPDSYFTQQGEFKKRYFSEYVEKNLLKNKFNEHIQDILKIVVLLRRFDIRVLNTILKQLQPSYPDLEWGFDDRDFFELINTLGSIVKWKKNEYGYVINPSLRQVLQEYVRFIDPGLFRKVNRFAIKAFHDMLQEGYRQHFLVEQIYHSIVLYHFTHDLGDYPINEKISEALLDYLNGESASQMFEDDLDALRNALQMDNEICKYINLAVLEAITGYLRARLIENKVLDNMYEPTSTKSI